MKRTLLSIMVIMACAGCSNENFFNPKDKTYFPLHVGDRWYYKPANELFPDMNDILPTVNKEIISTASLNGKEYFLMVSTAIYPDSRIHKDSVYYRLDSSTGIIYQINGWNPGLIVNEIKLAANVGDRWRASQSSTGDDMTLSSISTMELGSSTLEQCKRYDYDVVLTADEEHHVVLAPGLGTVAEGNAWGFNFKLQKAIINGSTFQF